MPVVKTREELVKNYDEISSLCRESREPVVITADGREDLAVMSIELYEEMSGRLELYGLLREGMDDVRTGRTEPLSEAMKDIRESRKK